VRVLLATAELAPVAAVGGLAQAAAGLVRELRRQGLDVEVALPDYGGVRLEGEERLDLDLPAWAAPAVARRGFLAGFGDLTLVAAPGLERPHPYLADDGTPWADNDARFFAFSAGVAALAYARNAEVVHLNDWHTAAAAAWVSGAIPVVLSIHNLAFQGRTSQDWLARLGPNAWAFDWDYACNPLAGAIALAQTVVVVSPTYREEVLRPEGGAGLDWRLRQRADSLVGILNGIDAEVWDPAADPYLPVAFSAADLSGKEAARAAVRERLGLSDSQSPLAISVTRLTHQKGIDLLLALAPELESFGLQLGLLGAGDAALAAGLREAAAGYPETVAFVEGYDESLSHQLIGGGDVLLMPSRFEPSGLAQMQALRYGTLPVVTDVGGLHDTVVDLDEEPERGTGWRARAPEVEPYRDALTRAVRGWSDTAVRRPAQHRGMTTDWSWTGPAARYVQLYERLAGR